MTTLLSIKKIVNKSGIHPPALALERLLTTGETIGFSSLFKIDECNESLIEISGNLICCAKPHPHLNIGATYGKYSPFCVREGVLEHLQRAAELLSLECPGYKLYIYDAYRPLSVQRFMIDYEFSKLVAEHGLDPASLDLTQYRALMDKVLMVWAHPDEDQNCPPPHSTGAAIDLTIIDDGGEIIDMGSAIDAIGEVSLPNYFADSNIEQEKNFHSNRELLNQVMTRAGFQRLPHEWWHFSFGDQVWAMLEWLDHPAKTVNAIYGRVEI